MIMGGDKLVGFRCHGIFDTGVILKAKKGGEQGKCIYVHCNNRKGENDLILSICET